MIIEREGLSITLFTFESKDERDWLEKNTNAEGWQWLGNTLAIDTRFASDLVDGIVNAGFTLRGP